MPAGANPLDTILGMGYAGWAQLNGRNIMLLPSSADESEELIMSDGTVSTSISRATGFTPVRNRRILNCSLTCDLTPNSLELVKETIFDWRNAGTNGKYFPQFVYFANDEGYSTSYAYVTAVSLQIPPGDDIGKVSFTTISYIYWDSAGTNTPKTQAAFNPTLNLDLHQPIPGWAVTITHSGQPGTPQEFSLGLSSPFQFRQLTEGNWPPSIFGAAGVLRPPNPGLVYPDALTASLVYSSIASPNDRPLETADIEINIGNSLDVGPYTLGNRTIIINLMYRNNRNMTSLAEADSLVRWSAQWDTLQRAPTMV